MLARNNLIKLSAIFLLLFYWFHPAYLFPQSPPLSSDAGVQAERYKIDTQQEKKRLEYKKPRAPEIEIEEKKEAKPAMEGVSFVLRGVRITGATVFKPEDFRPLYQPYLNQKVTFSALEAIMQKIKDKYKQEGYITTIVYFPEQEITEGVIEVRVAEGKIGDLKVEGNKWFSPDLIKKYFHLKNKIFNIKEIQRDILRLNKIPDLEVKTVVTAGKEVQTSDVILKVTDKYPCHIAAGFDNHGTRLVGKLRSMFILRSSNVSGRADTVYVNSLASSRSLGELISYVTPVDTYGTKMGLDFTYFEMKIGKEYKSSNISGITYIGIPYLNKELYLSDTFESYLNFGMEMKSIKKKTADTVTTHDELRLPYFGFDFSKIDLSGRQTSFSPKFIFSVEDFLGASDKNHPSASRVESCGFFFEYEHTVNYIQKMPIDSYITVRSQFQVPTHTLPSSEQFQLGGANSVRGYPEGDYLADWGGSLNFDWAFPLYLIPESWKLARSEVPLRRQIEPVVFFDIGGGRLNKVDAGEIQDKLLAGIGGGLRIRIGKHSYLRLEWAEHLGDRPVSGCGPSTFYFTFQIEK